MRTHRVRELPQILQAKFLTIDTLTAHQKAQETRLKYIKAQLGCNYSLLSINRHDKNGNNESKNDFNLDTIIRTFKNKNLQYLWATLASVSIAMFAVFLLRSTNS